MSNGLKALDKAKFDLQYHRKYECDYYYPKKERQEYITILEKELKALEIIKNKWVDLYALFIAYDLEDYNIKHTLELTQEEFELLKGVIC